MFKDEIVEIIKNNYAHLNFVDKKNEFPYACPLDLHCKYSIDQVLTAFGYWNEEKAPAFREGAKYFEDKGTDIFFITLNKSDRDFSPSTLYEDNAINERLFHWQTQSRISEETNTAKRYINHKQLGKRIALFVREFKEENNYTSTFVFLGEAEYVSHEGNTPMSIVWRLKEEMPPEMVPAENKAIGQDVSRILEVAAAIIENAQGQLLIARRKKGKALEGFWEFPGGKIENNETVEECLKRELQEEMNILIRPYEAFGVNDYHYGSTHIRLFAHKAKLVSGEIVLVDHDEYRWVDLKDLGEYTFAPADIKFVEMLMGDQ